MNNLSAFLPLKHSILSSVQKRIYELNKKERKILWKKIKIPSLNEHELIPAQVLSQSFL